MDLMTSSSLFVVVPALVDVPVVEIVPATGNASTGGSVGAKEATRVEGTAVETVGIVNTQVVPFDSQGNTAEVTTNQSLDCRF